jgi:FkbM family methyltransferase
MHGWGHVVAIEAQERLFYALAGNLVLHNCFNARAIWGAIGNEDGFIDIPEPDYCKASSFGSFELRQSLGTENIGQVIDYDRPTSRVRAFKLDNALFPRIDLIKITVEGMEFDVLQGARDMIARYKPMIFLKVIKVDRGQIERFMTDLSYRTFSHGVMNVLAVHKDDPVIKSIQVEQQAA